MCEVKTEEDRGMTTATKITNENVVSKRIRKRNSSRPSIRESTREVDNYECYICHRVLPSMGGMKRHLSRHDKKLSKCSVCGERFSTESSHQHLCQGNEILCEYCPVVCHTTNEILRHLEIHKDNALFYYCGRCAISFNMNTLHVWHEMQHDRFTFACEICGKKFATKRNMKIHLEGVHSETRCK